MHWEAADSGGKKVPLQTPSLVNSGRYSVRWIRYWEARKFRGPENPALCCRPTFVYLCVCVQLSVFVCVCRHRLWSRSLLVHRSFLSLLTYSPSPLLLWYALNSFSFREFQWTGEWLWGQLMSPGQGYTLVDSSPYNKWALVIRARPGETLL